MFGRDRRLFPWGRTETYYVTEIAREAVRHLGFHTVRDFLKGHSRNPGQGLWFYVLNFLKIMQSVRLRNVLSNIRQEEE